MTGFAAACWFRTDTLLQDPTTFERNAKRTMRMEIIAALLIVVGTIPAGTVCGAEIQGRLTKTDKGTVTIESTGDWLPAVGDRVKITSEVSALDTDTVVSALVAEGRVTQVSGNEIIARIDRTFAAIELTQTAKITSENPQRKTNTGVVQPTVPPENQTPGPGVAAGSQGGDAISGVVAPSGPSVPAWSRGGDSISGVVAPPAPVPAAATVPPARRNLMKNPGFEADFTDYKEEYDSAPTARFMIDNRVVRSGAKSLLIINSTPAAPNVYRTLVQTIGGLKPNTTYRISFWVRSQRASSRTAFNLIMDGFQGGWRQRILTAQGAYDWTQFSGKYNTGSADRLVLRFITEDICSVWLDDIEVNELP
jgi:hypothetical protein